MNPNLSFSSWRKEYSTRSEPTVEKKSSMHVASEIKTFDNRRDATDVEDSCFRVQSTPVLGGFKDFAGLSNAFRKTFGNRRNATDVEDSCFRVQSTPGLGGFKDFAGLANAFSVTKKRKREQREPWDYNFSYYPTTLPLRRPYSGDSGNPDSEPPGKAEFENDVEYDETTLHSASDLGLMDQDKAPQMLFLQFPTTLPMGSPHTSANVKPTANKTMTNQKETAYAHVPPKVLSAAFEGTEIAGNPANQVNVYPSQSVCSLEELPKGYMGKMLVYKSGAVKLKLGDFLYDVSPGSDCIFAQRVMAINTITKYCVELAELKKRAVVSPDIDSLVDNVIGFR